MARLFTFLVFCIAIIFSIANKASVTVSLWPFPYEIIWPLSLLIICVFFIAFLCGAIFMRLHLSFKKKVES